MLCQCHVLVRRCIEKTAPRIYSCHRYEWSKHELLQRISFHSCINNGHPWQTTILGLWHSTQSKQWTSSLSLYIYLHNFSVFYPFSWNRIPIFKLGFVCYVKCFVIESTNLQFIQDVLNAMVSLKRYVEFAL